MMSIRTRDRCTSFTHNYNREFTPLIIIIGGYYTNKDSK